MNDLQIFNNEEFGQIRTVAIDNDPWFVGKDVAEALGYSNAKDALIKHVDDEDKRIILRSQFATLDIPNRGMTIINESGLYSLIFSSKLKKAKDFKHWVTSEILPSIRKTGGYVDNDEAFINTYLPFADEQTKTLFKSTLETVKSLNNKIEKDKPKVLFADAVETAQNSILIGDLAKLIKQNGCDIGQKRLFEYLRNNGFLIKSGVSKNMPTQRSMDMKLFEVKERTINNPDGSVRVTKTTKVTGKGQVYFISKFVGTKKIDDGM